MTDLDLRTPDEWFLDPEFGDTEVIDPDGWRGFHDLPKKDWSEPISREEYRARLMRCTVCWFPNGRNP